MNAASDPTALRAEQLDAEQVKAAPGDGKSLHTSPTGGGARSALRSVAGASLRAVPHGRALLVLTVVLAAAASGASVALMGVAGWLLSRAAEMPPVLYLEAAAVGVRFFGVSRGFFRYTERLVGHDLALRMQAALRVQTYTTLARTTLLGRRAGDLISRIISDVAAVQDLVVRVVVPFCSASIVILGTTIMLGRFSPASAAVLLVCSVLAGLVVPVLAARASVRDDELAAPTRGRLADAVHTLARTTEDLVAHGQGGRALELAAAQDAELRRIETRTLWVRGLAQGAQLVATGIAIAAALWIGGQAVADGTMAPRLLAVLVLTPLALHEVFGDLAKSAQTFTRTRSSLERLHQVLTAAPIGHGDAVASTSAERGAEHSGIAMRDATVGWPGGGVVLEHVNLEVGPGVRTGLVGPSGIGKTTIASTLMGAIDPLAGQFEVRGRVGYLSQNAHIFATTVAQNVKIGNKDATDEQVADALRLARLDLDPERMIGEAGSTLSGGEARRLAMARLFVHEADVWILDEPTEHLDQLTASDLMADLWQAAGQRPVLVITHDPAVIAATDHTVRLG